MKLDCDVGIVGAGFGGIIAALELARAGRQSFLIFERGDEVGGVWRDNVYPGCACDVPSHLYSIATRPNPEWTASFAGQTEILEYLKEISVRDDLRDRIRFGREVVRLRFLADDACWEISADSGETFHARSMIVATGPHSRPKSPELPGQGLFAGTVVHSSRWDAGIDLRGKHVAVIGTGASAIQIVPNIAPAVEQLTVFQRSAPWILPRAERQRGELARWLYRTIPATQTLARAAVYWSMEAIGLAFTGPRALNRVLAAVALRHMHRQISDPVLRAKLTPNYRPGCKRMMVSDDYYPALARENVQLVTEPIREIVQDGVVTADGSVHRADHLIYATGFTVADPDGFLHIEGLRGRVLADEWAQRGGEAYLGTTVSGFPNLVLLLGPNSGLSHSSALHVMESQMIYAVRYLEELHNAGSYTYLDVRPEVQDAYNSDLQRRLATMIWSSGCTSWYLNRAGKNTAIFPGLTASFRRRLRRFDPDAYERVAASNDSRAIHEMENAGHGVV